VGSSRRQPGKKLEHFHKFCSHAGEERRGAVFLIFGFVSAQSQAAAGMLLRQSLAKKPKILAPHGYSISSNALGTKGRKGHKTKFIGKFSAFLRPIDC
jgi:hypothetical protein